MSGYPERREVKKKNDLGFVDVIDNNNGNII